MFFFYTENSCFVQDATVVFEHLKLQAKKSFVGDKFIIKKLIKALFVNVLGIGRAYCFCVN